MFCKIDVHEIKSSTILIQKFTTFFFFSCFQHTYTGEFIVQKKHYLYHDIQTQLHLVI